MTGEYFVFNGELKPVSEARVSLDDIYVVYGFGVYETLKVRKGVLFFPDKHAERLLHSARLVEVNHPWQEHHIVDWLQILVQANRTDNANIKVLLYGGRTQAEARLYVLQLAPLFPDRKLYKKGAKAILFEGERWKPQAKSLNMLLSALAFQRAQNSEAYDALFVNRNGQITEGTRTNFWYTDGVRLFTPPQWQVLEGVTQQTVLECAREKGLEVVRREIGVSELTHWKGAFLTSTSTRVMPLRYIDANEFEIPDLILDLEKWYEEWLENWALGHNNQKKMEF